MTIICAVATFHITHNSLSPSSPLSLVMASINVDTDTLEKHTRKKPGSLA